MLLSSSSIYCMPVALLLYNQEQLEPALLL